MRIVYRAANIADAHVVRQILEAEGIPAFVQGEYLQGAVGELPAMTEILVHASDEHADDARGIVAAWESTAPADGDMLDETFDDLPDDRMPDDGMLDEPQGMRSGARDALRGIAVVIGLVVVVAIAVAVMHTLFAGADG